ncbi:MAG: hypothetical protein KC493_01875 [Bacteriovoracaceae bacterium]|nr:hypothetical protein [Bacteriovoracaceae bacterium]
MFKLAKIFTLVLIMTASAQALAQNEMKTVKFFEVKKELWVYGVGQLPEINEEMESEKAEPQISEAYPEELLHALESLEEV